MALHLDSDLLRTFVAVAETGNFTARREQVNRTQSAVSMQIKRLEEMVGDMLFSRGPRGVGLTRKGGELLSNARRIVSLLDETAASMSAPPLDGPVRIGIPEEYGHAILSRALGAFAKRHPQVEITVRYAPFGIADGGARRRRTRSRGGVRMAGFFRRRGADARSDRLGDLRSHRMHEETPLPIAIYQNPAGAGTSPSSSLEAANGLAYRVAYTSDTTGGLKLAVTSGLAIAPIRAATSRPAAANSPPPTVSATSTPRMSCSHRNPDASGEAIDGMAEAIREAFFSQGRAPENQRR